MSGSHSTRTTVLTGAALWLPLGAGLVLAWGGERSALGAMLLLAEPLLVVVALYLVLWHLLARRWLMTLALGLGWAGGICALHVPAQPSAPAELRPEWTRQLRACSVFPEALRGPVRLVHWSLDDGTFLDEQQAIDLGELADIVVLHGTPTPDAGAAMASVMEGDAKFYAPSDDGEGGMTIVVRGSFQPCGDTDDAWALELPAARGHGARAMVTFPKVEGVGAFPLVAVRLDPPHGPTRWGGWPDRLADSSRRLAAMVQAIDASRVVLVGDFQAPPTFRRLSGRLLGAGLAELPLPPTWPTRVGPLPTPRVHRLDRLWVGSEWQAGGSRVLDAQQQLRAPVAATLQPDVMQAR